MISMTKVCEKLYRVFKEHEIPEKSWAYLESQLSKIKEGFQPRYNPLVIKKHLDEILKCHEDIDKCLNNDPRNELKFLILALIKQLEEFKNVRLDYPNLEDATINKIVNLLNDPLTVSEGLETLSGEYFLGWIPTPRKKYELFLMARPFNPNKKIIPRTQYAVVLLKKKDYYQAYFYEGGKWIKNSKQKYVKIPIDKKHTVILDGMLFENKLIHMNQQSYPKISINQIIEKAVLKRKIPLRSKPSRKIKEPTGEYIYKDIFSRRGRPRHSINEIFLCENVAMDYLNATEIAPLKGYNHNGAGSKCRFLSFFEEILNILEIKISTTRNGLLRIFTKCMRSKSNKCKHCGCPELIRNGFTKSRKQKLQCRNKSCKKYATYNKR